MILRNSAICMWMNSTQGDRFSEINDRRKPEHRVVHRARPSLCTQSDIWRPPAPRPSPPATLFTSTCLNIIILEGPGERCKGQNHRSEERVCSLEGAGKFEGASSKQITPLVGVWAALPVESREETKKRIGSKKKKKKAEETKQEMLRRSLFLNRYFTSPQVVSVRPGCRGKKEKRSF